MCAQVGDELHHVPAGDVGGCCQRQCIAQYASGTVLHHGRLSVVRHRCGSSVAPSCRSMFHIVAVLSDNTEAHGEHPFSTCLFLGIIPSLKPSPPVRFRGSTAGKSRAVVHILQGTAGSDPAIPFVGRGHDGLVQAFVCCLVRCALGGCLPHLRYRLCYGRATNTCESSNAGSISSSPLCRSVISTSFVALHRLTHPCAHHVMFHRSVASKG